MNYRRLPMIALLAGICVLCLPLRVSAGEDDKAQNFFSGPVLATAGAQFSVCATNVSGGGPHRQAGTVKILIGLLSADDSRILKVREAALNTPGQGPTGACLSVSAQELQAAAGLNSQGPINVVAFAGDGLSAAQGFLIEGAGGIPGGGCITASLQIGDGGGIRYIPMAQH